MLPVWEDFYIKMCLVAEHKTSPIADYFVLTVKELDITTLQVVTDQQGI